MATGSSHVGSESTNDDSATYGHDEDNLNAAYRVALETLNWNHAWSWELPQTDNAILCL
jgi:hypothetical protein